LTVGAAKVKNQSMAMSATTEDRIKVLHDRAVAQLVEAHRERTDEPLILAVRYALDDPDDDIHLLEVLDGFPGGDGDELMETEFERSANLIILGKLHLVLGSPAQVRTAVERGDKIIAEVKSGKVVHTDSSKVAGDLKHALGL